MSYKKVQQLADRFIKTAAAAEDYTVVPAKTDHFTGSFLRNVRVALNELEGDLMTLKYRDFNRKQWKELGDFWRHCVEIYKAFNESKPEEGIQEFVNFLLEKKEWLTQIMPAVQKHLKSTEVDFVPHPNLSQARADGLKELIKVINEGAQNAKKNVSPAQSKTWRPPSRTSPVSTFVGTPDPNRNSDEQTGVATPRARKEAL